MEGAWRGASLAGVLAACCCAALALALSGCGDEAASGAVDTTHPETAFAPVVQLDPDERFNPMGARWFLEHAILLLADDQGCGDSRIAVGRTMPELQNPTIDWIFPIGLGRKAPNYWRNPDGPDCELNQDVQIYASQRTRPFDARDRPRGLRPGEGFYVNLADDARRGQEPAGAAPAYVERTDEGDSGVRLRYWFLYGFDNPPGRPEQAHEGDWESVDVMLERDGDASYAPRSVRFRSDGGGDGGGDGDPTREVPWDALKVEGDTHPVLLAERGSHALSPSRGCARCRRWRTWEKLTDARDQLWYGFGGAWGEIGPTSATTGPLGPNPGAWLDTPEQERRQSRLKDAVALR